jgi:hypothetical protein
MNGLLNVHNKPFEKWIERGLFKYKLYHDDEYRKYTVVTEEGFKYITQLLFPQAGDNPRLEAKLDLVLKSNEAIMERLLIMASLSSTSEDQRRVNIEKMRTLHGQIKNLYDENSSMLNLPEPINMIQLKLDTY